VFDIKHLS